MSRHGITYKPGGAIGKPLDMAIKMQRETPAPAGACTPKPTGLFWYNPLTAKFDLTAATGAVENLATPGWPTPVPPFFYAARLEGELCGRDNDVVITPTWLNSTFNDSTLGPHIWTSGNILIVSPNISNGVIAQCEPGILTATVTLPGVIAAASYTITLVITLSGGYY